MEITFFLRLALTRLRRSVVLGGVYVSMLGAVWAAETVKLTEKGGALLPIVIAPGASEETERLARDLANGLQRITGATFVIERNDAASGIVLGIDADWPGILPSTENPSLLQTRENYLLKTEQGRLLMVGRTPLALQDAIWDLFYRLGFRQFFPGATWEIWPKEAELQVSVDALESPDFYNRNFSYGGLGAWKELAGGFQEWKVRNRMVPAIQMHSGHAYGAIFRRNREHFEANPDDRPLKADGTRSTKFDPSQPSLLALVAEDAIRQYEKNPLLDGISVEPSDGGGWRIDSPLGSPSNQAVTVANHAARAIQERFPGKKVCMLAYHEHSPPPAIDVDPNVVVTVQTYAIKGGFSVRQLLQGWQARGGEVGVSDFLSLWVWNRDSPGVSKAADIEYLSTSLPNYYNWGARYWNSGISPAWAPNGLGYYLASRFLWDTREANKLPELLDDFYTRAFGEVAPEMRDFFERYLLKSARPLLSEDLLGRMYRQLDIALAKTNSSEVGRRIVDFIAYVRTLELRMAYENASGQERQDAYNVLVRFAYGIRDREMVSSRSFIHWGPKWDKSIVATTGWEEAPRISDEELVQTVKDGITRNSLIDFEAVAFSENLRPERGGAPLGKAAFPPVALVGVNRVFLYAEPGKEGFDFEITGAQLWKNRGPVQLSLYADENPVLDEPVATVDVPADGTVQSVHLASSFPGLHRLEISDNGAGTDFNWPAGIRAVLPSNPDNKIRFVSSFQYDLYFYVPKGTKIVGGFSASPIGVIKGPDGAILYKFTEMSGGGYFSVSVPAGEDGKWWSFAKAKGSKMLLTVPSYLSRSPEEGLIPEEVLTTSGGTNAKR